MEEYSTARYHRYACAYPRIGCHGIGHKSDKDFLYINSAGIYLGEVPTNKNRHSVGRDDFFLVYNYSGRMFVELEYELCEITSGELFLLKPACPHSYWYINDGNIANYWIHFTGYGAEDIYNIFQETRIIKVGTYHENSVFFNRIIDELLTKDSGYQMKCIGYFLQLIGLFINQMQAKKSSNDANSLIADTVKYIRENYQNKLFIPDLARMACMGVKRFTEEFREHTGMPPKQYIVTCRLEQAIGLMTQHNYSICEASEMVGFENQMYFSRLFKKHMNMTPSQYRKVYTGG